MVSINTNTASRNTEAVFLLLYLLISGGIICNLHTVIYVIILTNSFDMQSCICNQEVEMADIISTIAGKIEEINISVGDGVTEDDEAFIIGAMKMETVIYGEEGTVKEILVSVGDNVEEDQVLAVVE